MLNCLVSVSHNIRSCDFTVCVNSTTLNISMTLRQSSSYHNCELDSSSSSEADSDEGSKTLHGNVSLIPSCPVPNDHQPSADATEHLEIIAFSGKTAENFSHERCGINLTDNSPQPQPIYPASRKGTDPTIRKSKRKGKLISHEGIGGSASINSSFDCSIDIKNRNCILQTITVEETSIHHINEAEETWKIGNNIGLFNGDQKEDISWRLGN